MPNGTYYPSLLHSPTVGALTVNEFTADETGSTSTLVAAYSSNATHALPSILANAFSTLYKAVATAQGRTRLLRGGGEWCHRA